MWVTPENLALFEVITNMAPNASSKPQTFEVPLRWGRHEQGPNFEWCWL